MIYLTFNDHPSGVFQSQVIDVILELNLQVDQPIKLVSFISIRNFWSNRRKIKLVYPNSLVLMMLPGLKNWKLNVVRLGLVRGVRKQPILARGPMAFYLANKLTTNVSYDGRGAVKAELIEYPEMIPSKTIVDSIISAERSAVLKAKFKIAVSEKLVDYWRSEFNYVENNHIVIPCTLTESRMTEFDSKDRLLSKYNWSDTDIILIYSGSIAGWQSFEKVSDLIEKWIKVQNVKVLFLSQLNNVLNTLIIKYPNNIKQEWVSHDLVANYLSLGDYGILIREENMTNLVASPVKFAEYLNAGLQVLISEHLGDYSALVKSNGLGYVINNDIVHLTKTSQIEKNRMSQFVKMFLTKEANRENYQKLISEILK